MKFLFFFFFFLSSSHLRCSGLIFRKRKKKPRVADFLLDIKGRSGDRQLSVTAALPGSGEVVRVEQEGEAVFILHLAWHAFTKYPVSFLCFSYQESFSWIFYFSF